jgi:hypothetical protein
LGKSGIEAAGRKSRTVARPEAKTPDPAKPGKAAKAPVAAAPAALAEKFEAATPAPVQPLSLSDVKKDGTAWASDVGALLKKYGATDALKFSRPIERVLVQVATIDRFFAECATGESGLIKGLVEKDARRWVFMLEGFLRLYEPELGHRGKLALMNVKLLEDSLGNISLNNELVDKARAAKLPGPVVDKLQEQKDEQKATYERFVEDHARPKRLGRSPLIQQVIDALVKHQGNFHGYHHDRRNLFERLSKIMHKLGTDDYDMTQPAAGIHELRRNIRWLPIDIEALNGLVVLDDTKNPVAAYKPMLQAIGDGPTDLVKPRFVTLPAPTREPEPLHVSKSLYTAMMDSVLKLGAIKDKYEPLALLSELYVKMGLAKDVHAARDKLDPLLDPKETERDYQGEAKVVYDALRKNDLFGAMSREYADAAEAADKNKTFWDA